MANVNASKTLQLMLVVYFVVQIICRCTTLSHKRHPFHFTLVDIWLPTIRMHALTIHTYIAYPSHMYTLITLGSVQSLLYLNVIAKHLEVQYHQRVCAQHSAMPKKTA
jgi:hypothetical protein